MKQRRFKSSRPVFLISIGFAILALGLGIIFVMHNMADADTPQKTAAARPTKSQFSFSGSTGWHQGPADKTSMVVFADDGTCFAMMYYKTGTVDGAAKIQKQQEDLATTGATMTPVTDTVTTVTIGATAQHYVLHQYSIAGGSEKLLGGLQLGYIQLSKGYLEIQGHCNTTDELPSVIPALQAYNFTEPK